MRLAAFLSVIWSTTSFPSYRTRLPNGLRVPCPPGASGCEDGICNGFAHETCAGGLVSPVLNAFGEAFKNAGYQWTEELCKADSDGDGQTNGEELGDPCCEWREGDVPSSYMRDHVPSHPGNSSVSTTATADLSCNSSIFSIPSKSDPTARWNDGEERREISWLIKNYTLPKVRTTYVDFVFNFDDESHDVFHIVWGEAIVDLKQHLHHFVVTGCSEKFPEDEVGKPRTHTPAVCDKSIGGFAGWAPGNKLWDNPVTSGTPIGKGVGVVAVSVNVHYTDADKVTETLVAQDGIRLFYTPDLRPSTSQAVSIINIGGANVFVPPQQERWFMTRKCVVSDACVDNDQLAKDSSIGDTCAQAIASNPSVCTQKNIPEYVCPKSCNACESVMPITPVSVNYHAHLLGREMYFTLQKAGSDEVIDLNSVSIWYYDDQAIFTGLGARNITVDVGDTLQTTCVYNSMERNEPTKFGRETVDEMCINTMLLEMDTNVRLSGYGAIKCEGSIWTGSFEPEEDPRQIANLHPESSATDVYSVTAFGTIEQGGDDEFVANCPEYQTWVALCSRDANIDCEKIPPETVETLCDEYKNDEACKSSIYLSAPVKQAFASMCNYAVSICGDGDRLKPDTYYFDPNQKAEVKCGDAEAYCKVSYCGPLEFLRSFFKDSCCEPDVTASTTPSTEPDVTASTTPSTALTTEISGTTSTSTTAAPKTKFSSQATSLHVPLVMVIWLQLPLFVL